MQPSSISKRTAYLATGGAGTFVAVVYLGLSLQLPLGPLERPGAGVFPVIAGAVLMLASLVTLIEGWRMEASGRIELPAAAGRSRMLGLVALLLGYFLALPWAGQLIASALFCALMMRLLSDRSWPRIAAYALAIAVAVHMAFVVLLKVPMPRGVLGI